MKRPLLALAVAVTALAGVVAGDLAAEPEKDLTRGFERGAPAIQSMSSLAFAPQGILLVGDGKAGAVWALDLGDTTLAAEDPQHRILDFEAKVGALLGTNAADVMIHDMAANPISRNVYLAVSRGRSQWESSWQLPNEVADATVLVRVDAAGELAVVALSDVPHARASLPKPIDPAKQHPWKEGSSLRADAITDMAFHDGTVWVAGLSNEEFASTMWRLPFPFGDGVAATTLEIFHGAHGEFETQAPIRTFVPYRLKGEDHLLAAYLCTPLVTFETASLADGQHVKGRTVAEFGWGNYPLDMVVYEKEGKELLLIANSSLPMMIVRPEDIESYDGAITTATEEYEAGVPYEARSGTGFLQLDRLSPTTLLVLQRQPSGKLAMVSAPADRY